MKIEITSLWTGVVLFAAEVGSIRLAVELAVKSGANLGGANLWGATETLRLETGETPETCPMAVAFGVRRVEDVPLLYRPRAEQFVCLFDAGLLPNPMAEAAARSDV